MTQHTAETAGERLDLFVARFWPELSRAQAQRLIAEGQVLVDGLPKRPSHRMAAGECVTVEIPGPRPSALEPQHLPVAVVYQDPELLVVDKPAGLVVHPGPGHPDRTLVNALLALIPDLKGIGGELRPGIVHRLDRDTSGLILIAKSQRMHDALSAAFERRQVQKTYLAVVHGTPEASEGVIDAPIARDRASRQRMAVVEGGRAATTHYRVLGSGGGFSLVEVRPETGRTHQIRLHLAAIRHSVAGDAVYGVRGDQQLAPRQLLHAWRLSFAHPLTGARLELESPIPEDFLRALESVGIPAPPSAMTPHGGLAKTER